MNNTKHAQAILVTRQNNGNQQKIPSCGHGRYSAKKGSSTREHNIAIVLKLNTKGQTFDSPVKSEGKFGIVASSEPLPYR